MTSEMKFNELNVVMVGLPGSGKSTLMESFSISPNYLSLGDITRREINSNTKMGKAIREKFKTTDPWSADFVMEIVAPYISQAMKSGNGFVLDGVPRKVSEAKIFVDWAKKNSLSIDLVLNLHVSFEIALVRIAERNNAHRLETAGHYKSRIKAYMAEENEMLEIMRAEARKSLDIDTNTNSPKEVNRLLFNFVTDNF